MPDVEPADVQTMASRRQDVHVPSVGTAEKTWMPRSISKLGKSLHAFRSSIFARVQQYLPASGEYAPCAEEGGGPGMSSSERAYGLKRKRIDRWSVEAQKRAP
jgi:hypothetical protein